MYNPEFQQFSSAYTYITTNITCEPVDTPQISQPFIEDIWYWMDDVNETDYTGPVYLRKPKSNGHIQAELSFEPDLEQFIAPEATLRALDIRDTPTEETLWLARPGHATQLNHFHI